MGCRQVLGVFWAEELGDGRFFTADGASELCLWAAPAGASLGDSSVTSFLSSPMSFWLRGVPLASMWRLKSCAHRTLAKVQHFHCLKRFAAAPWSCPTCYVMADGRRACSRPVCCALLSTASV